MRTLTKPAGVLAIAATIAFAPAPAQAQFGSYDQMGQFAPTMEQFAPMMEHVGPMLQVLQRKIGKKRMAQLIQAMEPMMSSMMPSEGGDYAMPTMMGGMMGDAPAPRARRKRK